MMDFEDAAARLARDQSKMRGRTGGGRAVAISDRARRQAEHQRKQQARLRAERDEKRRAEEHLRQVFRRCEARLGETSLGGMGGGGPDGNDDGDRPPLLLTPTSVHGDGDKIALPPSVLEGLTSSTVGMPGDGDPWTFRIGIPNPSYAFPSSPLLRALKPPVDDDGDDSDSDDGDDQQEEAAFLDELSHRYLSYTHCTVVEFTQDEGCVGIPRHVASALLDGKHRNPAAPPSSEVPTTRTVDPASASPAEYASDDPTGGDGDEPMGDASPPPTAAADASERTPGHLAWGAFDVPATKVEITMVRLPKGRGCTLVPTPDAVRNNFYGLRDVKLVLEQSLIRTRATLSRGDVVTTWHRGTRYELDVTGVTPSAFGAVTCINTDIEVDIGEADLAGADPSPRREQPGQEEAAGAGGGFRLGSGHTLSEATQPLSPSSKPAPSDQQATGIVDLLPEPPADQREGVCSVQIRFSGGQGKRRFAVDTATVKDLFAFAASLMDGRNEESFRLVTRFPRRELSVVGASFNNNSMDPSLQTLAEAGVSAGQELFLVENLQ